VSPSISLPQSFSMPPLSPPRMLGSPEGHLPPSQLNSARGAGASLSPRDSLRLQYSPGNSALGAPSGPDASVVEIYPQDSLR
jgi:hypothetical protein